MRESWHLLQLGTPVTESERPLLHRVQERLSGLVEVGLVEPPTSGLQHEAGCPEARAEMLVNTLAAGAVAVLVNGPGEAGLAAGDPVLAQVLPFLPRGLSGTIIGAIRHAHVLTLLKTAHPELTVLMAPPVMEILGFPSNLAIAEQTARDLATCTRRHLHQAAHFDLSHQPAYQAANGTLTLIEAPAPVTLQEGEASGPIIAGNLMALAFSAGHVDWPRWDNPILLWEAHRIRLFDVERYLQRLKLLRILDSLGGMLVGVPLQLITSPRARLWVDIVKMAFEDAGYPICINAFIGTGWPCPILPLGETTHLAVTSADRVILEPQRL